ncbi:adhesin [Erwinia sp. S59]|uniref:adhesin n=1 Tax=Erwinia sp. S59 TaxID=2769340 RepID=UPI00190C1652|nr:adhesin [Erwinia sp. S59]MBK0089727.1 adhesin [Erwinia sp. S59]
MKLKTGSSVKISMLSAALLFTLQPHIASGQITIGKDKGIFPTGLLINVSETQPQVYSDAFASTGVAAIGPHLRCATQGDLKQINGIWALPIAQGIGLAPNVTATASYTGYRNGSYQHEILTGKITPEGSYATTNLGYSMTSPGTIPYHWCLSPVDKTDYGFFRDAGNKSYEIRGEWMLVTDGTQKTGSPSIPIMRAMSLGGGTLYNIVIPAAIPIRVSTLECTINTPTTINFGAAEQNFKKDTELAKVNHHMGVTCTQDAGRGIDTNINVRFKALSGLHEGNKYRLKLDQGGGYITGSLGGVTYDGRCGTNQGITFDNAEIKIGEIYRSQLNKSYSNPLVWRLCSGGSDLPSGRVTATAEMMVTYN